MGKLSEQNQYVLRETFLKTLQLDTTKVMKEKQSQYKRLFLKTSDILIAGYGETKLVLTRKLLLFWLDFRVPQGVMQAPGKTAIDSLTQL